MDKGYNPDYGARPLRRAIGSYIEDPLAESLLSGEYLEGQTIEVTRKEDQDHLYFTATGEPTKAPESSRVEPKPDSAEDAEASAEASSDVLLPDLLPVIGTHDPPSARGFLLFHSGQADTKVLFDQDDFLDLEFGFARFGAKAESARHWVPLSP